MRWLPAKASRGSRLAARIAGITPMTMAASSETASAKTSTRKSTPISPVRGNSACASSARAPANAIMRPSPAPAAVRTSDSAMNRRATRKGAAPRARRNADSRSRERARASMRFATFTQATSSSAADAPSRTVNAARTLPASCSMTGRAVASTMSSPSPYCCLSRAAIALRSCCAAAADASSCRRPTT
jgi:hypothetical protein